MDEGSSRSVNSSLQSDATWIGLISVVGLILRVLRIDSQPLWSDEAETLLIAKQPAAVLMTQAIDPTPGLYYVLHKLLIPDSASLLAIRSISLVAGVLLIPLVVWFGSRVAGRRAGLVSGALVALSAPLIDYSQEARTYSLLTLLIMGSAAGLLVVLKQIDEGEAPQPGPMALFGLGAVLAFYAHFASVFWIAPAVLLLGDAAWRRRMPRIWRPVVLLLVVMGILALPGLVRLVRSLRGVVGFHWLPHATPAQFLATIGEQVLPTSLWTRSYNEQPGAIGPIAGIILLQLVALHLWSRKNRVGQGHDTAVLAIFALAPLAMWLSGFLMTPTFMPRTMLWTVPGLLVMIAAMLVEVGGARAAVVGVAVYAIALIFSGTMRPDRQDPRPIIAIVRAAARPGDLLMTCQAWRAVELRASVDGPLPMPLVAPVNGRMSLLEAQFGGDGRWISHFGYLIGRPRTVDEPRRLSTSGRAWLVASNCGELDWDQIKRWLGPGRWVRVREDAPEALLPNVLWRFDPTEPSRTAAVGYLASD